MKLLYPGLNEKYSLHNHSELSDGSSSLETLCRAGKAAGLKVFGVSDHWVIPPCDGTDADTWAMAPARLDEYVETLLALKKVLDDDNFTLKLGLEVDFFFENIDDVLKHLSAYPLDYLIGSVHYAGTFPVDHLIDEWLPLSPAEKDEICEIYWQKLAGAAQREEFCFLGHLDLPKKFGQIDNSRYFDHAVKVLDILADNGGAIELNTAGYFKECGEPYPSTAILQAAADRNIPLAISADAHCPEHVTRNFAQAAPLGGLR